MKRYTVNKESLTTNLKQQVNNSSLPAEEKAVLSLPKLGSTKKPSHTDINESSKAQPCLQESSSNHNQMCSMVNCNTFRSVTVKEFVVQMHNTQRESKSKWFRTTELAEFLWKEQPSIHSLGA